MAPVRLFIIIAVVLIANGEFRHEVQAKTEAKKALAVEKEQRAGFADAGREPGSLQKLSGLMNKTTEDGARRGSRRRGKNLDKILQMNRKHKAMNDHNHMMNDNEGAIAINQKTMADNETNSLTEKMKVLINQSRSDWPTYEAVNKYSYIPQVTGVYCGFENSSNGTTDMCSWQWNSTVSSHGLGFKIVTAADLVAMNATTRGLKFSGPSFDADRNVEGNLRIYFPSMSKACG